MTVRITHQIDRFPGHDQREIIYNFIVYDFDFGEITVRARAYLFEIEKVSILGVFQGGPSLGNSDELADVYGFAGLAEVASYLGERVQKIDILGAQGYSPFDPARLEGAPA